ncbi:MAG: hypothetical protein AAGA92_15030 [Planctomycetota bacterium]
MFSSFRVLSLAAACALTAIAAAAVLAQSDRGPTAAKAGGSAFRRSDFDQQQSGQTKRLREGTMINSAIGTFEEGNSGAKFVSQDGQEFGGLPNLNLERVVRMLKSTDESDKLLWSVSGTVTEYSGRNYLLISRAVYKSMALPPLPKTVETETASVGP